MGGNSVFLPRPRDPMRMLLSEPEGQRGTRAARGAVGRRQVSLGFVFPGVRVSESGVVCCLQSAKWSLRSPLPRGDK